jgi:hypothetical protein
MIDLATAAAAAALLNNSVSAVDKVYNWWQALQKQKAASEILRSDPKKEVLQYVSGQDQAPIRVVMTYAQLATKLNQDDFTYIQSFEQRMSLAMGQWEKLNARLPLLDSVERARVEANMDAMKNGDICTCLREIVGFIEKLNIDLHDHYASVRRICPPIQ